MDKGYFWEPYEDCEGTLTQKLDTGDYSLVGFEDCFTVDRKGKLSEFVSNLTDLRFTRELERMAKIKHSFLLLEFEISDVMAWPYGAGIPNDKIKQIKTTPRFIIMKMNEIMIKYGVKIIFAGTEGKDLLYSLFKRVAQNGR